MTLKNRTIHYLRPSQSDQKLLESLNLDVPTIEVGKGADLGEARLKDGTQVFVWAKASETDLNWIVVLACASSGKLYTVDAGPGPLSKFWPAIKLIAAGLLIVVKEPEEEDCL